MAGGAPTNPTMNSDNDTTRSRRGPRAHAADCEPMRELAAANVREEVFELERMCASIQQVLRRKAGLSTSKRAGHVFEEYHAGTFNAHAARAGDNATRAVTGANGGFNNHLCTDIRVMRGGTILREVQAKCCATPARSAAAVSKAQYGGLQRLVPKGQGGAVREQLTRLGAQKLRSSRPSQVAKGHARLEAASQTAESISAGGHHSRPLSHSDSMQLANGNLAPLAAEIARKRFLGAATSGAATGAAIGAGIEVLLCGGQLAKGAISSTAAARKVATAAASTAVCSAATGVVAEGMKLALARAGANTLAKGGAAGAIASCVVETTRDAIRGEFSPDRTVEHVTRAAAGTVFAKIGGGIGTLLAPGIGTAIGLLVGGGIGSLVATMICDADEASPTAAAN